MAEQARWNIGRLFSGLRPKSRFSMETALRAAETDGVSGTLVIQVPSARDKPCEVHWTDLPSKVVSESLYRLTD